MTTSDQKPESLKPPQSELDQLLETERDLLKKKVYGREFQDAINRATNAHEIDTIDRHILYQIALHPTWTGVLIGRNLSIHAATVNRRLQKPTMQLLVSKLEGSLDSMMLGTARKGAKRLDAIIDDEEHKDNFDAAKYAISYVAKRVETEKDRSAETLPSPKEAIKILQDDPALSEDEVITVEPLE